MKKLFFFLAAIAVAFTANAKVTTISPDAENDALRLAVHYAEDGDIIEMNEGTYVQCNNGYVAFDGKSVTVKAAEGANVVLQLQVPITLTNGGKATLQGIKIDASRLLEKADWYEHVIYSTDATEGKQLVMDGCELYGFNLNKSAIFSSEDNKLALCDVKNCYFHDNMKSCFFFEGASIAELSVVNSTFANIATDASSYYAGPIDVRNADAKVTIDHCTFYDCKAMSTDYATVTMKGPQAANVVISNNIFALSSDETAMRAIRNNVNAKNCLTFNYKYSSDSNPGLHSTVVPTDCQLNVDPMFVDAANGNFALADGSPALTAGTDGKAIGDPRWNVVAEPEPTTETVYFINTKKWAKVNAYAWNTNGDNGWPGKAATKEAEQIAGFDVYSFTANAGQYANVIFNNKVGDTGSQTSDLVWTAGQYYVMDMNWMTKEEAETKLAAPIPDVWTIVGAKGILGADWNLNEASNNMTLQADGTYQLVKTDIVLAAGNYDYKAAKDHAWTTSVPQSGNQTLKITTGGTYDVTFVLNVSTKKLTATATLKQEVVVIPTIQVAGDMTSWADAPVTLVMAADSLTATATIKLDAKTYEFKMVIGGNWQSDAKTVNRDNNSTVFTGANSDTNTKLVADQAGDYIFTWTYETKTLTVTYPALPVKYNVTVTAENGTVTGAGEYEEGKTATLTATPAEGYEFVNWTVGEEVVSTENPYTFTVTADAALVANFKEVVKAIEVNVTGATASVNGQNIDINAQWNEQSMLIMLWQGGATQGFGTYAAEDYGPIMLGGGMKELTPTTEGVYADNGDGTFTFTCSATDGTTQYNITVIGNNPTQGGGEGDVEEPEYPVMEDAITNLVLDLNTMTCKGGPSSSFSIIVELYIGEPNVEGTLFNLTQESTISVMGNPATFVSGYIKDINTVAPSLTAVVVAQLSEFETYQFEIAMSAEEIEAMPIEVTNANITVEEYKPFPEAMPEYSLNMKATWTDAEGITYPVTVKVYTYDPNATEATESLCDVKIGDIINDPWLGGVDGCYLTITTENGVVTATGTISNLNTGFAADFTISGSLAQGPSTGVENLNGTVAPVKVIENGQIFIIRNGVKYNAQGAQL